MYRTRDYIIVVIFGGSEMKSSCISLSVAIGFLASLTFSANADPSVSKEEIIQFFANSADLGVARGICVGTAEECAPKEEVPGFDMLINFEYNSDELTEEAKENLEVFNSALADNRLAAARFIIEGHTDSTGTESYNKDLSERRAASVVSFLLGRGVSENRVIAVGMGESSPRVDDTTAPENRRVEMRINLQ